MPAPKKTTKKTTTSKAKTSSASTKSAGVATATKKAASTTKKATTTKKPAAKKPAAKKVTVSSTKTVAKKTTTKKTTAAVVAQIDVGFGNRLTIRGEGAGLSWNAGQTMTYADGAWTWTPAKAAKFEFKILLNDEVWAQGDNMTCAAGKSVEFTPYF